MCLHFRWSWTRREVPGMPHIHRGRVFFSCGADATHYTFATDINVACCCLEMLPYRAPNNCTTAAASYPMSVHEKEPLHNNAHARGPHPPGVSPTSTSRDVSDQAFPASVRARNDNEAYNANVSGEAWERGYLQRVSYYMQKYLPL